MKTTGGKLLTAFLAGFVIVILIRGLTGCSSGETDETVSQTAQPVQEIETVPEETPAQLPEGVIDLGNAVCPVMGLEVMEGQFLDWEGYRIHFCCAGCDQQFLDDPERYLEILSEDPRVEAVLDPLPENDSGDAAPTETVQTGCHGADTGSSGNTACSCCS